MTNTQRLLGRSPRQETPFDPFEHEDPVAALADSVRRLKLGGRVRLPDNTLVLCRTVKVGPNDQRRFSIVPPPEKSTPAERHRIVALGFGAHKTAVGAAKQALGTLGEQDA